MYKEEIINYLDKNNIEYDIFNHPPAYTVEDILSFNLPNKELGAKNLFLRDDKKKNYYLVVVQEEKPFNVKNFQEKANTRRLSFASDNDLNKYLKVTSGAVSPFGILNDDEKMVKVYIDNYFKDKSIWIHPNDNTASILIDINDLIKIIEEHGNFVEFIEI